jgi:C4-dicarboxylate-specific signal transduction histidine kinase
MRRRTTAEVGERIKQYERADERLQQLHLEPLHGSRWSAAGRTAALAHELGQPLSGAPNSVNAARRLLQNSRPDQMIAGEALDEPGAEVVGAGAILHHFASIRQHFQKRKASREPIEADRTRSSLMI